MYSPLIFIVLCSSLALGQQKNGCKKVARNAPDPYNISPGTYDPTKLNVTYCVRLCGAGNYNFAGLELGNLCLCAAGTTDSSTEDTGCTMPCTGEPSNTCGGPAQADTYKSAIPIEGLMLKITQGIFSPDQDVDVASTFTKGADLTFEYRMNDWVVDQQTFKKKFRIPGTYSVQLTAKNPMVNPVTVACGALIDEPVGIVDLHCPVVVPKGILGGRDEEFECWGRVTKGSWLSASMNFVDVNYNFDIADPISSGLGAEIPVAAKTDAGTQGALYLANGDPQRDAGSVVENGSVVIGFEYYATTPGDVTLLVLEPDCPTGQAFCLDTNACSPDCNVGCKETEKYCPLAGNCVAQNTDCSDSTSPPGFNKYKVKNTVTHKAVPGNNWVPQTVDADPNTDNITLADGYIIGIYTSAGIVGVRAPFPGEAPHSYKTVSAPAKGTSVDASTYSRDKVALFRAVTNKPSDILLPHVYMNTGDFPTKFTVKNMKRPTEAGIALDRTIAVQLGVDFCIPTVNGLEDKYFRAKTKFDFEIVIKEPSGNGVNYEFQFGTDTAMTSQSLKRSYKFSIRGVYTIKVRCYNLISSKENETQVIVEDKVEISSLSCDTPKEVNSTTDCVLVMSSGSAYHCNWTWSDGQAYITQRFEDLQPTQTLQHTYVSPPQQGVYTVGVICSNEVDRAEKDTQVFIYERVENLQFLRTGAEVGKPFIVEFGVEKGSEVMYEMDPAIPPFKAPDGTPLGQAVRQSFRNWRKREVFSQEFPGQAPLQFQWTVKAKNALNKDNPVTTTVTFTIDKPMIDPLIEYEAEKVFSDTTNPDGISIGTGRFIKWTIKMNGGTSVVCSYDVKDGTAIMTKADAPMAEWNYPAGQSHQHTFNTANTYQVIISATNGVGTFAKEYRVVVYDSPSTVNAKLNHPTDNPSASGLIEINVTRTDGGGSLGDTKADFDWGDGEKETIESFAFGKSYTHKYGNGKFTPSVKIYNLLGEKTFTGTEMNLIQGLEDVWIRIIPENVAVNSPVAIEVTKFAGSDVTVTYDWGQGKGKQTETLPFATPVTTTYAEVKNYTIVVSVLNPVSSAQILNHLINVQHPVKAEEFALTLSTPDGVDLSPGTATFLLKFTGSNLPTMAEYKIDYGDGRAAETIGFEGGTKTFTHTYALAGCWKATMLIQNKCSNVTLEAEVKIAAAITELTASPKYTPRQSGGSVDKDGLGPSLNEFSNTLPLRIHPIPTGNVMQYFVEVDGQTYNQSCVPGSIPAFSQAEPITVPIAGKNGDFQIVLKAKNHHGEKSVTIPVKIIQGVQDFSINVDETPGNTKKLSFKNMKFNDDTCLHINFGDGVEKVYGGASCQVDPYKSKYPAATFAGPLSDPFEVEYTYSKPSAYQIRATLEDKFATISVSQPATASTADCGTPNLYIRDANPDFTQPKQCQRGYKCIVQGVVEQLNCQATLTNSRSWRIEEVDEFTGKFLSNIPMDNILTSKQSSLIIPERSLKYGLYRFVFETNMDVPGIIGGFMNLTATYVKVVQSQLVGALVSGSPSVMVRGVRKHFLLEPGKYSYDPDMNPNEDQGFDRFEWFCYESGEKSTEVLDVNKIVSINSPLDQATIRAAGGCFGTGPGKLNHEGPMVAMNPGLLKPDSEYNFTVIIHKEKRFTTKTLIVRTIDGDPPEVEITFMQKKLGQSMQTGKVISPTYKLLLQAKCVDTTCPSLATNRWTIYCNRTHFGWREIPSEPNYLLGYDSLKVQLNVPEIITFCPGTNYLKVQFKSTAPSRPPGYSELYLKLNFPPYDGTCDIQPREGVAGKTDFTITCKDWKDREGLIKNYEIVAYRQGQPHTSVGSMTDAKLVTQLLSGSDVDDYSMTLEVLVNDFDGSTAKFDLGKVKVTPESLEDFEKEFNEIMEQGGKSKLAMLAALQDPYVTTLQMAAFSSSLNKFAAKQLEDTMAEEYTSTGYEKNATGGKPVKKRNLTERMVERAARTKRVHARKECMKAFGQFVPVDISQTNTLLTGMAETIKETADTSREMQDDIIAMANRTCESVKEMGTEHAGGKLLMAQENLVQILGYYMESQSLGSDAPCDDDLTESAATMQYDTNLHSEEPWQPANVTEAQANLGEYHNSDMQQESVNQNQAVVDNIIKCLTEISRQHSVPGGGPNPMNTPKLQVSDQVDKATNILGKKLSMGRSTFTTPAACDVVKCDEDNPDPVIGFRTMAQPNTPWKPRVKDGQSTVPPKSDVLTIEISDEDGKPMAVKDLKKEFELWINREASLVEEGKKTVHRRNITYQYHMDHFNLKIDATNRDNHYLIKFYDYGNQILVFFRYCYVFPNITTGDYNFTRRIPEYYPASSAPLGYEVPPDPNTIVLEPYLVNTIIDACDGNLTMAVRFMNESLNEYNKYNDSNPPPKDILTKEWNYEILYTTEQTPKAFDIVLAATTCNYYDKVNHVWRRDGMRVGKGTTVYKTQCFCNHLTSIGSGWVVVPNKLDFGYILANLDPFKNPTLYITFAIVIALYILFAVVARRLDNKDVEKCGLIPIWDNSPKDHYLYEMTVVTGIRSNSGTDSKVYFILSGEFDETEVRVLNEQPDAQKYLKRGSIETFLLAVPRPLGPLNYMRVWHDNQGKGKMASWYLKYITLQDVQTKEKFSFIAGRWFAVEEDDGQIDRLLPVAGREQVEEFGHLFSTETRKNLGDGHLWFSVIGRPPRSRFTRLQRVSCCFQILMLSMGASTLFYGQEKASGSGWSIGPFTITPRQITIAVFTNLIIFPPTFLTVWLFRKTKPRNKRPNRILEALDKRRKAEPGDTQAESHADTEPLNTNEIKIHTDTEPLNENEIANDDTTPPRTAESIPRPLIIQGQEAIDLDGVKNDESTKKKKKRINLPWWMLIVSWVVLWVTLLIGAALLFMYGVMFGDEILRKWLTSFIISVVMSAFITQPIKVFLLALFVSLILKKTSDEDEEEEEEDEMPFLQKNEEWLYNQADIDALAATRPKTIAYKPTDPKRLEALRENRVKEVKMYAILTEIFCFIVFISVLLLVSYGFRDPKAYQLQVHMQRMMLSIKGTEIDFMGIANYEDFYTWLEKLFIPALRADLWYTNNITGPMSVKPQFRQPFGQRGFKDDRTSRMMGWAIMRQLRIPGNTCRGRVQSDMRKLTNACNDVYDIQTQEEGCFGPGWTPRLEQCPANVTGEVGYPWRYHSATELQGFIWPGQLTFYSGGGYPFLFRGKENNMSAELQQLKDNLWVDKLTRAVFLEWALFNPNSGLFSVNTMLVEFPMTTGVIPTYRFEPMDLLGEFEPGTVLIQYVAQISFILFLIYYLVHEIREMVKLKGEYITEIWNWNEMSIIILSFMGVGIYFYRMYLINDLVARFMATRGLVYIKFQIVAQWHEILMYIVGLVVFFSNLKFIRLLRFNRRMSLLGSTLRQSGKDLFNFGIMFSVIFFSYVQLFYLLFLRYLEGYKTVVASAETNMNIMLGKFDFQDMMDASPMLAPIFFFLYVLTMVMIVMNMFISILCETFTEVRSDLMKQGNDFEMVDFMLGRFKSWTGIGRSSGADSNVLNNKKPADGVSAPFEVQIDNFPHKVDKLLDSICKVYFDNVDNLDMLLDPGKFGGNKELYKNLLKNNQVSNKNIQPETESEEHEETAVKKEV